MAGGALAEENKTIIRHLIDEMDKGNLAVLDEYFAPSYVDHNPTPIPGLAPGIEGAKQSFHLFHSAFPNTQHVIEDLIAEGDKVVARISARGTHRGELIGIPATGKEVRLTGIAIYRFADGKIVERWAEQGLGVLQQLGLS